MKLAYQLFLITTVPAAMIWTVGLYATSTSEQSLRESIETASKAHVVATMDEIDRTMSLHLSNWQAYTDSPEVQLELETSNEAFSRMDERDVYINREDDQWKVTQEGTELARTIGSSSLSRYLGDRVDSLREAYGYPVFNEVFITNKYGVNVAQTGLTSDYRQNDESWWINTEDAGVYIGDVEYDDSAGVYSTALCIAIKDAEGQFAGVLKVVMNVQAIIDILETRVIRNDSQRGYAENLVWLARDGRIIASMAADGQALSLMSLTPPVTDGAGAARVMVKSCGWS